MRITIKKGKRYPFPYFGIYMPILTRKDRYFKKRKSFEFTMSCIYDLKDDDQHDVNKLYGFSVGFHHKNSFRFGWRPNADLTKIEIVGYEYRNGVRTPTLPICEVDVYKSYTFQIRYVPGFSVIQYSVCDDDNGLIGIAQSQIQLKHKYNWGYKLGLYFGGNEKAPHDIIIYKK